MVISVRAREGMIGNFGERSRGEWLVISVKDQEGMVGNFGEKSRWNGW